MPSPLYDFTEDLKAVLGPVIGDGIDALDLYGKLWNDHDLLEPVLIKAVKAAKAAGLMRASTNGGVHDFSCIEAWNRLVVTEDIDSLEDYQIAPAFWDLHQHIARRVHSWRYDPTGEARAAHPDAPASAASIMAKTARIETVTQDHLDAIVGEINDFLQSPETRANERPDFRQSHYDGAFVHVIYDGWMPLVATYAGDNRLVPLPDVKPNPPIRHYEIETNGRLVMFSSSDTDEELQEDFHTLECDTIGLPHEFSADLGANNHALDVYAASGILPLHFGDHFPTPHMEGDLIRGMTSGFSDPTEGIKPLYGMSLDKPALGDWGDLARFVGGDDKLEAMVAEGVVIVVEVPAGTLHLYAPDGWRAEAFADVFEGDQRPDCLEFVEDEQTYFVISPTEIDFAPDLVTKVEMPERGDTPDKDVSKPSRGIQG